LAMIFIGRTAGAALTFAVLLIAAVLCLQTGIGGQALWTR